LCSCAKLAEQSVGRGYFICKMMRQLTMTVNSEETQATVSAAAPEQFYDASWQKTDAEQIVRL
jgi:predicted RNA-binding protein YlxR (DUF448 family)